MSPLALPNWGRHGRFHASNMLPRLLVDYYQILQFSHYIWTLIELACQSACQDTRSPGRVVVLQSISFDVTRMSSPMIPCALIA